MIGGQELDLAVEFVTVVGLAVDHEVFEPILLRIGVGRRERDLEVGSFDPGGVLGSFG